MDRNDIFTQLCIMSQKMEKMGLVGGTAGNISFRLPGEDLVAITPSGIPYDLYTNELMCVVDLEGRLIEGTVKPSSETPLHTMLHRHLKGNNAIVHTHSPFATTFAVLGEPIKAVGLESIKFGAPEIMCTNGFITPGSSRLGEAVIETLDRQPGAKAALLQNHGLIAIGNTIEDALNLANTIEFIARLYFQARCIGEPKVLSAEQISKQIQFYAEKNRETNN